MKPGLKISFLLCCMVLLLNNTSSCQDSTGLYDKIIHFPDRLFKKVDDKTADMNNKLTNQSEKYLQRLASQEKKLKNILAKKDSTAAAKIFGDVKQQYADLENKIQHVSSKTSSLRSKYIPHLDSLKTAFSFIGKTDDLLKKVPETQARLTAAMKKMDVLQEKFNQADQVKKYLQQRRQYLQEQLSKYGMSKNLEKLKKQVYYYQAQVEEYKKLYDEPSKLETKALELLKQSAVFRDFFSKNSQLAGLFNLPGSASGSAIANLAGLQTRDAVEQELKQKFGLSPDVKQMMQQQVQEAQSQLNQLKGKINKLGGGASSDKEMPDFKSNNQKTKSFKSRLEVGTNLQTVKSNYFFPSTTDIGLSVGYKLNDKSVIGMGSSYKMGWGKDIRHISITHQGVGLRSFVDYKLKGGFWLSGGAELNYRSQFSSFKILDDYNAWQKSALIGVSKKYQVSKKVKGNMQLMYDFLWKQQVPRTQAVLFRVGYLLK